jgi:hypothetical protein
MTFVKTCVLLLFATTLVLAGADRHPLDPRGEIHIPIGVANTVDTLKTFVEAEGNFSPGFGTYGIYFWVWDGNAKRLYAPTMDDVECEHGLAEGGLLIPWSRWSAGDIEVTTEVCEVQQRLRKSTVLVAGARTLLRNTGQTPVEVAIYVSLRPLGAAGWPVRELRVAPENDALLVDGHTALVAKQPATASGVLATDTIRDLALAGKMPDQATAESASGDCSGALRYDLRLNPGAVKTFRFLCPVLAGRRAVGHKWDGVSTWAQFDLNKPNPDHGGYPQPDPGLEYFRQVSVDGMFADTVSYWESLVSRCSMQVPDPRWTESFAAIVSHCAMCMNEGAPDVAVVNYNVFNRDGMYVANIFQKSGNVALAEAAIDYFLSHPFNGRVYPEADNPGQILWVMGEHWKFTRDRAWLERVYPSTQKIASMIRYYRTTPGPHWVWDTSLDFGDVLPANQRKELEPGKCDGYNPNYTEAYDIAGLRGAAVLAEAIGNERDADLWTKLADELFGEYDKKFGENLPKGYGSYSVLWPCRLYPFDEGKAYEQLKDVGAQDPTTWRYFPLATAHQGLLAGNREAGWKTLNIHMDHPQMKGWYALDEGGHSGTGGWNHVRTRWKQGENSVAMPHGWAIAEFVLLLRDSLIFEDGDKLLLFAGVPPEWFKDPDGMAVRDMPTHFGECSFAYDVARDGSGAILTLSGGAAPPAGFILRMPQSLRAEVLAAGKALRATVRGDYAIPSGTGRVEIAFSE